MIIGQGGGGAREKTSDMHNELILRGYLNVTASLTLIILKIEKRQTILGVLGRHNCTQSHMFTQNLKPRLMLTKDFIVDLSSIEG